LKSRNASEPELQEGVESIVALVMSALAKY
jgi:hypothetical protein